jgi:flagellar biosynthetic protein FliQ
MEAPEIIEIIREAIYVLVVVAAPIMIVALTVGVVISLLQALTQIQEATLTFVPKVLAMVMMLSLTLPFIVDKLTDFTNKLQDKIVHIE